MAGRRPREDARARQRQGRRPTGPARPPQRAGTTLAWRLAPGQSARTSPSPARRQHGDCRPAARVEVAPCPGDTRHGRRERGLWTGRPGARRWPTRARRGAPRPLARPDGGARARRRGRGDDGRRCALTLARRPSSLARTQRAPGRRTRRTPTSSSSASTRCAPTPSAPGAGGPRSRLPSTRSPRESDVWLEPTPPSTPPTQLRLHPHRSLAAHHGVHDLATPLPAERITLAERLAAEAGYDTASVVAIGHLNAQRSGLGQGVARAVDASGNTVARVVIPTGVPVWSFSVLLALIHATRRASLVFVVNNRD